MDKQLFIELIGEDPKDILGNDYENIFEEYEEKE